MQEKHVRKNYLINKDLQGQYIFYIFLLLLVACLIYTFIIGYVSSDSMTITYGEDGIEVVKTSSMLLNNILKVQWIFMVTGGVIAVVLATFISHRFAGPLYKFEKSLEAMAKGNHSFKIILRPKDEGQNLAELINKYNAKVNDDMRSLKNSTSLLRESLSNIEELTDNEEILNALEQVHAIENRLRHYRINY